MQAIPIILRHYPDRVGQAVLLDSPQVFNVIWRMLTPLLDHVMRMKAQFIQGEAMRAYFDKYFSEDQTAFLDAILKMKGAPKAEAFPLDLLARVRVPLDPEKGLVRGY